jgi:hypothetical protein
MMGALQMQHLAAVAVLCLAVFLLPRMPNVTPTQAFGLGWVAALIIVVPWRWLRRRK